jgi:hypothetical protein
MSVRLIHYRKAEKIRAGVLNNSKNKLQLNGLARTEDTWEIEKVYCGVFWTRLTFWYYICWDGECLLGSFAPFVSVGMALIVTPDLFSARCRGQRAMEQINLGKA